MRFILMAAIPRTKRVRIWYGPATAISTCLGVSVIGSQCRDNGAISEDLFFDRYMRYLRLDMTRIY